MKTKSFERSAGVCAIFAGLVDILYGVSFVVLRNNLLSALFLVLGGLLSGVALVAAFSGLFETDLATAIWGLLLGVTMAIGSVLHGGYDLAIATSPSIFPNLVALPSQINPHDLFTFGIPGLAFFGLAWLLNCAGGFPKGLSRLGYLLTVLLIAIYLARLIPGSPTEQLAVGAVALVGVGLSAVWYVWLGLALLTKHSAPSVVQRRARVGATR